MFLNYGKIENRYGVDLAMGFISTHEQKNYGRWANLKALNTLALERSLLHQMFMINDLTFAHLATQITTSIERLSSKTGTDK